MGHYIHLQLPAIDPDSNNYTHPCGNFHGDCDSHPDIHFNADQYANANKHAN